MESKIFVTYVKNKTLMKATLNEEKYNQLKADASIEQLTVYPNELLMEQNFSIKINGVTGKNKQILNG